MSNRHVWWSNGQTTMFPLVKQSNGQTTMFPLVKQCHKPLIFSWWYIPVINIINLETVDPFALTTLESWRIYKLLATSPFYNPNIESGGILYVTSSWYLSSSYVKICKNSHPTPWLQGLDLRPKLADENAPGIIQDGHGTRASLNASQELSARTWGKKKQFEL